MDIRFPFDPTTVHDPSTWQPLRYVDGSGKPSHAGVRRRPVAAGRHVRPQPRLAALSGRAGQVRIGDYRAQAQALLDLSAGLTDEQKMIAEYWAEAPTPSFRPGTGTCSRSSSPAATTTVLTSMGSSGTSSSSSRSPTQSPMPAAAPGTTSGPSTPSDRSPPSACSLAVGRSEPGPAPTRARS
jgi:hypothetical protein